MSDPEVESLAQGDIKRLPSSDLLPLAQDGSVSPESIAACLVLSTQDAGGAWKLQAGNKFLRRNGRDGRDVEDALVLLEESMRDVAVARLDAFDVLFLSLASAYKKRRFGDIKRS